jgi:Flp pilus assembly protein protease CpaA
MGIPLFVWCLFGLALLIISLNDFLFFRIENELVYFLIVLYGISCLSGVSGSNFGSGFLVASGVFIVSFVLNRLGLVGGGDVKLLFPVLLFAENNLTTFIIGTSITGILLSACYLLFPQKILAVREKTIEQLTVYSKKIKGKYRLLLKIILPSLNRMRNSGAPLQKNIIVALRQEIPYGIAISGGGVYMIAENLLSR